MVLSCVSGFAGTAHATIYKRVDAKGHVTYSNKPLKGAICITPLEKKQKQTARQGLPEQTHKILPLKNKDDRVAIASTIMPANLSADLIAADTQKIRDKQRARILIAELESEITLQRTIEHQLIKARSATPLETEQIQFLEDSLKIHNSNIRALQKEIARMK